MRRIIPCAGGVTLALVLAASLHAQYNTAGFVRSNGWTYLTPINHNGGCGGGGVAEMVKNPLDPYNTLTSDPHARNTHDGADLPTIAFSTPAIAASWAAGALIEFPTWFTYKSLEEDLGVAAGSIPVHNRVSLHDSEGGNSLINWLNTNVMGPLALPALNGDNVMVVATTYVRNLGPTATFEACTASDDSIRLDVNNKTVLAKSACRGGAYACQERTPFLLPSGVSKITMMVWEGGGGFDGTFGIAPVGQPPLADGNGLIEFLGADDDSLSGQIQYCTDRTIAGAAYNCANTGAATVTVKGKGPGADGDLLTVTECITAATPGDIVISGVSNGGVVSDKSSAPPPVETPVGLFCHRQTVGNACQPGSTTTYDAGSQCYTSTSKTGGDLWDCANDFEFAYCRLEGDFDVAIAITNRTFDAGGQRWGKFGLIARSQVAGTVRHSIIQDHGPDLQDTVSFSTRKSYSACGPMTEDRGFTGPAISGHPTYYRLKRVGSVFSGWASDDPAVIGDPTNDTLWSQVGPNDDWSVEGTPPARVYVGFANSQHNSGGCSSQSIEFKLIGAAVNVVPVFDPPTVIGKTITWTNVPRSAVNAGLSYSVDYSVGSLGFSGGAANVSVTGGPASATWSAGDPDGAGKFTNAQDVFGPPTAGSTVALGAGHYVVSGSGNDIWDGGDQMHYAYQAVTGDFVATARLVQATNPPNARWGRTGLMARQTCQSDSKYSFACVPYRGEDLNNQDPPAHVSRALHNVAGSTRRDQIDPNGNIPRNWAATNEPFWTRLSRKGNYFYSEFAIDAGGAPGDWVVAGGDDWGNAPATVLVGLCSSSHGTAGPNLLAVEYDNVSCVPSCPITVNDCTLGATLLDEDFNTGFPGDDVVTNNAGAWTPATVDPGDGNSRLRLIIENVGGLIGVSHFNLDGLNVGDKAVQIDYDVFVTKTDANIEADGAFLGLQQGSFADYVGRIGGGGGALGIHQGDEFYTRRTTIGGEVDTWDGGIGSSDPAGGFGANAGGRRWHVGMDVNETYQSAQNDVEFGGPSLFTYQILNRAEGAHITHRYIPGEDSAIFETYVSDNAGGAPVLAGRAIGPRIRGDAVLTASAANGGATQTHDIDNLKIREISCAESAPSITISGATTATEGDVVALSASGSAGAVTWSIVSGPATVDGSGNVTTTGAGTVTVKAEVKVCSGATASDTHDITVEAAGGLRKPMDMNGDQGQDLSDAVALLGHLFLGAAAPPCGDNSILHPANVTLLDANGDGGVDLSDAVSLLTFLFLGGPAPVACGGDITCPCIVIPDCTTNC